MARIRSVKPEFWDDRKLAKRTSRDARLLYIALWNIADEHCRMIGDPQWIKGQAFAYDDDLDAEAIARLLKELEAIGAVLPYEDDGDPYLFLPKMGKHQRLEADKVRSRLPAPPDSVQPALRADEYARDADSSEPGADKSSLLYGAGGRGQVAGGRGPRGARAASMIGVSLLDEHLAQLAARPTRDVIEDLSSRIEGQLSQGATEPEIQEALSRMRLKPHLGPGVLPSLVNEVRQQRADPSLAPSRASPANTESTGTQRARAAVQAGRQAQALIDGGRK